MKEILVSGSTAFDTYCLYDGLFESHFQNGDIKSGLNMSLLAKSMEKYHGGTGANICYNLALLGEHSVLLSSVGEDFKYSDVITEKINLNYIHKTKKELTAHSIIFADSDDNRMSLFNAGAMSEASESKISFIKEKIAFGVVSANHIPTMLEHAREIKSLGLDLYVDPAQQISQMSHDELRELIDLADYLIVNQYELLDLQSIGGYLDEDLEEKLTAYIVTYGTQGSQLHQGNSLIHIPAILTDDFYDSTGAGDAYRAGVFKAIVEGYTLLEGCQLGSLLASHCVVAPGSQQHHFSLGVLGEEMKDKFSVEMDLYKKRPY
ncbi:carbohydrate kinase family protein [Candidatus Gracilibacteria bacterium]|nr:carbohydrate kinase family protein [Candidatus Gracilibacteria bacterium]